MRLTRSLVFASLALLATPDALGHVGTKPLATSADSHAAVVATPNPASGNGNANPVSGNGIGNANPSSGAGNANPAAGAGGGNANPAAGAGGGNADHATENPAARAATMSFVDAYNAWQAAGPGERGQALATLLAVARDRGDQIAAMVDANTGELLRVALPASIRASLPPEVAALVEQDADEDGDLTVLHVDYPDGTDHYEYALQTAKERLTLHFGSDAPANLMTGTRVHVHGLRVGQALALDSAAALTTTKTTALPNTLGAQKTLMILVNFTDEQTQPYSVSYAQNVLGTTSNYDYEASYQQTWLTSTVAGWFTIASSSTTCDYNTIASQAQQAATKAGYVLSNYTRLVYVFPGNTCGWWGLGTIGGSPSQAWIHSKYGFSLTVVGHEMGHNLGLYHSHSLDCGSVSYATSGCTASEYGDIYDEMGSQSYTPHYNAYQKERLGWLNAGVSPPLVTASGLQGTATYTIEATETARDTVPRAVKIPQNDSCTSPQTWLYVESRKAQGFDSYLSSNANITGGVLVHQVTEGNANSSYLLDMTPATTAWGDSALAAGATYTDPVRGVTITPTSVGASGASLSVTIPPAACSHVAPTVTLTPSSTVWTSAGATVTYTATVKNNDGCGCAASTFNLSGVVPTGWSSSAGKTGSISPGASGSASVLLTASSSAAAAFYNVAVDAANAAAPSAIASASGTVAITAGVTETVATDKSAYTLPAKPNQTTNVSITTSVKSGTSAVSGASVSVQVTSPTGSVSTLSGTTSSTGTVTVSYGLKKKNSPAGTYTVTSTATMGSSTATATTSFTVQ